MKSIAPTLRVAVVGAGIAGSACAQALSLTGWSIHVVDKVRGAGGRLATRRLEWLDAQGQRRLDRFDHGAPAFAARGTGFLRRLATSVPPSGLTRWRPRPAAGSRPLDGADALWLPQPDMPSLCRSCLRDLPTTWSFGVDRVLRRPLGWQVEAAGLPLPGHFDAVVLALPPAQAAALLAPHRSDWAQRASLALMRPCWTLMGAALGYLADAKRVDAKKYPKFAAGQLCGNCALYQGKPSDKAAGCSLFAGKQVAGPGWCSAWVKKT